MEAHLKRRSELSGIPLDAFDESTMESWVESRMDGKNHQIVFLSLRDLLRARVQGRFRTMVQGADLVLPVSGSIPCAAGKSCMEEITVYDPFGFVIKLLSSLEAKNRSVFLVGGSRKALAKAERNLSSTFPGLRIVGRHPGRYPRSANAPLMEAIRKAAPALILAGTGVPGNESWIPMTMPRINSGIYLWSPEVFTILATGRRRKSATGRPGTAASRSSPSPASRIIGKLVGMRFRDFRK